MILAVLSVIGGFIGLPQLFSKNLMEHFLEPVFGQSQHVLAHQHLESSTEVILMITSAVISVLGILVSYRLYSAGYKVSEFSRTSLYAVLKNKYYIDEIYDAIIVRPLLSLSNTLYNISDLKIIDGIVNGTGQVFLFLSGDWRKLQTGIVQDYAVISVAGIIAIIVYVLFI